METIVGQALTLALLLTVVAVIAATIRSVTLDQAVSSALRVLLEKRVSGPTVRRPVRNKALWTSPGR